MILTKKNKITFLNCIFFLLTLNLFCQTNQKTYNDLIKYIESENVSNSEKIIAIDNLIDLTKKNNNKEDEFRLLELKSLYTESDISLILSDELLDIANELKNDSLIEIALSNKSSILYTQRNFKDALYYSLKALNINKSTNNSFELYGSLIDIGNIYYNIQDYNNAEYYFNDALNKLKLDKKFIGSQGHLLLLYNLGKVYWKTNNTDKLSKKIKDIDELISKETNITDIAYLNYLESGFLYLRKDYNNSISYLNKSIEIIRKNDDYVNEHVGYLYLGKNLWQLNKKEEAIKYFEKVDSLFKKKKFLNYELREAYDYLIKYYKEDRNIEKQLEYTESLISLNKQFENEQKSLSNTLHYEYETKKLEESKAQLSKQLDYNNKVIVIIIILAVLFIIISIKFGIRQKKENKILRDKFDHLIKELDNESTESSNNQKNSVSKIELTPTEVKISKFLKVFELEKKYLLPIKLEDMVDEIDVSKTTLSQYFNNYKDGFNNYINDLRINEVLIDLKENENLREMSIEILSKKYGYNNSKTFFNQFKKITGIPPTYYIKQLNETINL